MFLITLVFPYSSRWGVETVNPWLPQFPYDIVICLWFVRLCAHIALTLYIIKPFSFFFFYVRKVLQYLLPWSSFSPILSWSWYCTLTLYFAFLFVMGNGLFTFQGMFMFFLVNINFLFAIVLFSLSVLSRCYLCTGTNLSLRHELLLKE